MIAQEIGTVPFQSIPALEKALGDNLSPNFEQVKSLLGQDIMNRMVYVSGHYQRITDTLAVKFFCQTYDNLCIDAAETILRLFEIFPLETRSKVVIILDDNKMPLQVYGKSYVFNNKSFVVEIFSDDKNLHIRFHMI
jgi:hypothetical protein